MPLTQLVHYLNQQLDQQSRFRGVPPAQIYRQNDIYRAAFGDLVLDSRLSVLLDLRNPQRIGHDSGSIMQSADGQVLDVDAVYAGLGSPEAVIHLDRLVRTLHSLNYLHQFDGLDSLLSLSVHPRHIASVLADHGKVFERVLADCGLGPERVLLRTRLTNAVPLVRFQEALKNYQSRGYRLAIDVQDDADLLRVEQLHVPLDAIFLVKAGDVSGTAGSHRLADARFSGLADQPVQWILVAADTTAVDEGLAETYTYASARR